MLKYFNFRRGKSEVGHLLLHFAQNRVADILFVHGAFAYISSEMSRFLNWMGLSVAHDKRPFSQCDCVAHRSKENSSEKEQERPSNPLPCFMGKSMLSN